MSQAELLCRRFSLTSNRAPQYFTPIDVRRIELSRILQTATALPRIKFVAEGMDVYEKPDDFVYMPHYQHYAAVLEAGGLQLSSPEQRYLISLIRRETRVAPRTASHATARRSIKHNIVSSSSRCHKPVAKKGNEGSRLYGLRTTSQEEDLLRSLLGSRDVKTEEASDSSSQSSSSACSSQDSLSPKSGHDPDPISSGHAAIVIPFSNDEDDMKPYITKDSRQ